MNQRNSRLLLKLATAGLVALSTVVAVGLAEIVVRFVVNPADFLLATTIQDEVLGLRIPPLTTGHDALGFRNRAVPSRVDIVAIGDSMTYGVSAPRDSSWPQQLGVLLGEQVYNMGLGGFGPLQYLHLAKSMAPALKPRLLIVGFYFGNDIMDAHYVANGNPYWHSWRISTTTGQGATAFDRVGQAEPAKRFQGLRNWLSRNSVLYSMLRETVLRQFAAREQDEIAKSVGPDVRMLWTDASNPKVRTIFTSKFRLAAVDLGIPAVRDGMQISQKAFSELKLEAARQGVSLLVVLIPTKELAYCRHLLASGVKMPESHLRLCAAETLTRLEFERFLAAQGMAYVDALPVLESHIDRHMQLYPTDADGHPQAAGYEVIAREVASAVRRLFPKK